MITAYSYRRWSDPKQTRGTSGERQLDIAATLCKQHDWKLDTSLKPDAGISGFSGFQKSLQAFIGKVADGTVKKGSVLIVEKLDRLSRRNQVDALSLFLDLIRAGITIATEHRVYDEKCVNDESGLLEAVIMFKVANDESEKKSFRSTDNWKRKRAKVAKSGGPITGRFPSWLTTEGDEHEKKFVKDAAKVKVVERIFAMAIEGIGSKRIAKALNADNTPLISAGFKSDCKSWNPAYIQQILRNRAVLGEFQPKTADKVNATEKPLMIYPPIIDEPTFIAARSATVSRTKHKGNQGHHTPNLFTGLLRDCRTGEVMMRSKSKRKDGGHWYTLTSSHAKKPSSLGWKYDHFEEAFIRFLREIDLAASKAPNLEPVRRTIAELEAKISSTKAKMKTAGNFDSLLDILADLEAEKKNLQTVLEQHEAEEHRPTLAAVKKFTTTVSLEDRQRLKSLIGQVVTEIWCLIEEYQPKSIPSNKQPWFKDKHGGKKEPKRIIPPKIRIATVQVWFGEQRRTMLLMKQGMEWGAMPYRRQDDEQPDMRKWNGKPLYGPYHAEPQLDRMLRVPTPIKFWSPRDSFWKDEEEMAEHGYRRINKELGLLPQSGDDGMILGKNERIYKAALDQATLKKALEQQPDNHDSDGPTS